MVMVVAAEVQAEPLVAPPPTPVAQEAWPRATIAGAALAPNYTAKRFPAATAVASGAARHALKPKGAPVKDVD